MPTRPVVFLLAGLLLGGLGVFAALQFVPSKPTTSSATPTAGSSADAPADPTVKMEAPPFRGLDSNLYMQTSAEYRACCLQAFAWADERVKAKAAGRKADGKPAAVVLDLDETVIDNGAFQARQIRSGRAYDQKLWDAFEEKDGEQVRLVPGAKEFLQGLAKQKVAAVYISNRKDDFRKQTHEVLKRLDLDVPDDQLHLSTKTSDKTERRKTVTDKFDVLVWVGDNLRDFDDAFKFDKAKGPDGRKQAVDERKERFGADWIILPNPAYGEWNKAFDNNEKDAELLK
jgi:5'-nucleotidase (lipoprotein e(P4) family)